MVPAVEAATISPASGLASPSSRLMTWNVLISAELQPELRPQPPAPAGGSCQRSWLRVVSPKVLDIRLSSEQLGVHAAGRHEFGMRAGFHRLAVFEHHHLVGVLGVGHAMGDHDHRLAAGLHQFADGRENQFLGFHIHTAGGLVEYEHRRIMQKRTGDGDTLALATGQVGGVGLNRHVKAVRLRTHEVGDTGLFERVPETGIHGVGRGFTVLAVIGQSHQKVLTQSTGKQMATGTDQGDGSGERLSGQVGYLDAVQRKRALVSGQRTGKQRGSRGFAGTGDADDGGELTGVGSEGEVGERRCRRGIRLLNGGTGIGAVIGIADVVEADGDSAIGLGTGLGTGISPGIGASGGRQRGSAVGGLGVSSRAKIRLVEVMPFIATWK